MSKAIGLVEVNGYVAAVEAADSALKTANVTLIGLEKVKAGITTVKLAGDVGAIKAAVDAAAASADSLGKLRAAHVIPRIDEQVEALIFKGEIYTAKVEDEVVAETIKVVTETIIEEKAIEEAIPVKDKSESKAKLEEVKPIEIAIKEADKKADENAENLEVEIVKDESHYNSMKVEELRRLVRSLQIPNMTNKQIKFAKKDVLVKAILEYNKAGED